jgi:hypothetical protein
MTDTAGVSLWYGIHRPKSGILPMNDRVGRNNRLKKCGSFRAFLFDFRAFMA